MLMLLDGNHTFKTTDINTEPENEYLKKDRGQIHWRDQGTEKLVYWMLHLLKTHKNCSKNSIGKCHRAKRENL